jgi:hypothetical protein
MYVVRVFFRSEYLKLFVFHYHAASLPGLFPFFFGCKTGVNRFRHEVFLTDYMLYYFGFVLGGGTEMKIVDQVQNNQPALLKPILNRQT